MWIIKNIFRVSVVIIGFSFFLSCGNKKAEERLHNIKGKDLSVPDYVAKVSALGKIEPQRGFVDLATDESGVVSKLFKEEGDVVAVGEVIFELKSDKEEVDEEIAFNQVEVQRLKVEADVAAMKQYEVEIAELKRDLEVSQRLAETGAETQYAVYNKKRDHDLLLAQLNTARKNVEAGRANLSVLASQRSRAQKEVISRRIRSDWEGRLIRMDVKEGSAISPLVSFATLIPSDELIVHGEIDEIFANRVHLGDSVELKIAGTQKIIARGEVYYLSAILDDKSLFYEKSGEQSDRRVRRFKASLKGQENLLINQKVECEIYLQD